MTQRQKRELESIIYKHVVVSLLYGISTRVLVENVYEKLHKAIPNMNRQHIWGMLSWVLRKNHNPLQLIVRQNGYSVISCR